MRTTKVLKDLGLQETNPGVFAGTWNGGKEVALRSPIDGSKIAKVAVGSSGDVKKVVQHAKEAQDLWKHIPTPRRGDLLRQLRNAIAEKQKSLAYLMSLEVGKVLSESLEEVDEMINVLDYANTLSRMMPGRVIPSERPRHSLMEVWNPLGVIGIITAFNYPTSVYGWNSAPAWVTGNATIWKPSETTMLTSIAVTKITEEVLKANKIPTALASLVCGGGQVGDAICKDDKVDLVSFTGSTNVGQGISETVGQRFGQTLLELGGNNSVVVCEDADIDLAVRTVAISALETNGQRCTTPRRLFLHSTIAATFINKLMRAYESVRIGDPLDEEIFFGPLHSQAALKQFKSAISEIQEQNGEILYGGKHLHDLYVQPTLCRIDPNAPICQQEAFVPILYIHEFQDLSEAIHLANNVKQGLSASLWSRDLAKAMQFIGPNGSDCGVVNVNQSTHWAELSTSFGGNKSTGWGREGGGEAWRNFVRWSSVTINHSSDMPLSQGIKFE